MCPGHHFADCTHPSLINPAREPCQSRCSTVSHICTRSLSSIWQKVSGYEKKKKGKTIDQRDLIHTGNRLHLKGTELTGQAAKGLNNTGGGILTSPFFPARYPRDLGLEYVVMCPNEASSCRIRLLFSDFQLATVSIMEVSGK